MSKNDPKEKQLKRFKALPEDWRNDVLGTRSNEDVNKLIRDAAINTIVLKLAKESDPDLAALKEQLATATEMYKEGEKQNNLKIEFLVEVLRSRGVDVPSIEDFIKGAKDEVPESLDKIAEEARQNLRKLADAVKG